MALDLLDQLLPHVQRHIFPSIHPLTDWKIKVGDVPNGFAPSLNDNNWTPVRPPEANWGAYDTTFWFRTKAIVPQEFANLPLALILDFSDGLLYVNGRPFHGLDANHQSVFLTEKARAGQKFSLAVQAYSGRKKEQNAFRRADLAVLNPTARALFHGLTLLRDLEKFHGSGSVESKEIRELIRKTLIYLKYFKPDGEEYPNAIGRAYRFLTQTLEAEFRTEVPGTVRLVGHSHLDVVWLWTLRETRRKAGRTFSTILRLMEEFPEFRFSQSQPLLYALVKQDYPELYKQIKEVITAGRWEPIGAMWVEPDCQIAGGESLIRHIQWGRKFFREEFGIDVTNAWLPDSFGFSWSLPQILARSGVKTFFTTKLSWNDTNKFPHSTFLWKGIDGSKVLAHMPPVGLEGQVAPGHLRKSWDEFPHKEQLTDVLQTYGYGDGGGGPVPRDLHTIAHLRSMPGLPKTAIAGVREFFAELEPRAKELPEWNHELYLEKHRGTFSTQARIKKANRQSESLLYSAELLSVLAMLNGAKKYPQAELDKAWKRLLQNQFHDTLSGTIIQDAEQEAMAEFGKIRSATEGIIRSATSALVKTASKGQKEHRVSVLNTLPWPRKGYVACAIKSKEKYFTALDADGNPLEVQVIGRGKGSVELLCYVESIPPLTGTTITIVPTDKKPASEPWKVSSRALETPLYRIRLDSQGHFTSIHDKRLRREVLKKGQKGNQLLTYHDTPAEWEAWELDSGYEGKRIDLLKFRSLRVVEAGPLRMTIEIIRKSDRGSVVRQLARFYHKSPLIEFATSAKWWESQILLKAAIPVNVNASRTRFEIQFGSIERPAKPKTPEDKAKFEVPVHSWSDMSDAKFGVSLLNDGKYGADVKESTLRLTLLRSPHYPHAIDPQKSRDRAVTDQGEHEFTYALWPHQGDWKRGETIRRAKEFNHPLLVVANTETRNMPALLSSLPPNVMIEAVKKAEENGDIIVRLYEAHGESTRTTIPVGYGILNAMECDLMEGFTQKIKPAKGKLPLKFSPFEIKTIRLRLRPRTRK